MQSVYDTKEGIEVMLMSLESFNQFIEMRQQAAENRERLQNFYLLGRFLAHCSGDVIKLQPDYFPPDMYNDIPPVLTPEEFIALVNQYGTDKETMREGQDMRYPVIPPAYFVDSVNHEGWTIETCHDAYPVGTDEVIDLCLYAGKTIAEVRHIFSSDKEKIYEFYPLIIFNEELIDTTLDENGDPVNQLGQCPHDELSDDYVIRMGDSANIRVIRFFHKDTLERFHAKTHDTLIDDVLGTMHEICEQAGFTGVELTPTPMPTYLVHYGSHVSHFATHVHLYCHAKTDQGSFGIIAIDDGMVWLDLTETDVKRDDLLEAMDLLTDNTMNQNLCHLRVGMMEKLRQKMTGLSCDH